MVTRSERALPEAARWRPGDHVITREVVSGKVWTVRPVTVVRDTPELVALYMMPGTIYKHPRLPDQDVVPPFLLSDRWRLVDVTWTGGGALYLSRPGDPYMVIGFWNPEHQGLRSWYVNLQDPFRRTRLGFDYLDQELDVIVSPDLSAWRWKDLDKLELLVERGVIPGDKAGWLRATGEQVVAERHAADSLFRQGWDGWSPPPEWTVPGIPDGWDVVE